LKIIAKEVPISETVGDRADLLAIDEAGDLVIIELKCGSDKRQLLQAIAYAGMAAKLTPEQIRKYAKTSGRAGVLDDFKDENLDRGQRILLVAEDCPDEILAAAEWLYPMELGVDGKAEYLTFTQIFPTPELA
jgi:hypothetical protein